MATKVCIITCYKQPDYVRAQVLRQAMRLIKDTEVIVVKNSHLGMLKYAEVLFRTLWIRLSKRPDYYVITFRGYEILPFVRLFSIGKKLIYDEFINPIEWTAYEHKKFSQNGIIIKLIKFYYRLLLKSVNRILTDTNQHAKFSSELMNIPLSKYTAVPVGTDEAVFNPIITASKIPGFQVFYYGSMLPLHGLSYVLEAAQMLGDKPDIHFLLVGGKPKVKQEIDKAKAAGARIEYIDWIPYKELPKTMSQSSLGLGGPYGNTIQGRMIITGKTYQMLAMGVPILIGDSDEETLFKDGVNCLIAKQGSAEDLTDKILWAYDHKSKLNNIGQAGRDLYTHHYSNQAISQQLADLLG